MEKVIKRVEMVIPTQPKITRVAAYARVSSGKDAMLQSLAAQVSYYSSMIQRHLGWLYCGVYSDEAFTGTKAARDGFQELLAECRAGNIDIVITKSISRFARNTVVLLETVRELKALGIDVFFEEQNIHTLSNEGELMLTILAGYAEEESRSVSENMKWRIRHGFENGELMCLRRLFGYTITRDGVSVNPKEAKIVRKVFQTVADGTSLSAVAKALNDQKVKAPLDGIWTAYRIHSLIANEKYCGNALLQKTFINNHLEKCKLTNRGELPMYYAEGTHPAIVDKELFERANAVVALYAERAEAWKPIEHDCFTGKIRCGICGNTYKRVTNHGHMKYGCRTYQTQGKNACASKQIPISILEATAAEALGVNEFDEELFLAEVSGIEVPEAGILIFQFSDGTEVKKTWKNPSRANSWTPEMKAAARERALEQGRKNNA